MNKNNKLTRAAVGRIRRLIDWPPGAYNDFMKNVRAGATRVSALTLKDKKRLEQAYQALHRAEGFRLLAEHAIPYIYLRGSKERRKKRRDFGVNGVNATMAYILETKKYDKDGNPAGSITPVIQAWDSRKSRFATWISNNTFYSLATTSHYGQKQESRRARDQIKIVAEMNASGNSIKVGESKQFIIDPQSESAADAFAWAEEFVPDGAPAATEHDLHLYDCLLNDKNLQRGRRRQRIIDLIGDGMDQPAIASLLGVSLRTIQGDYNYIRKYIGRERGSVTDVREFGRGIRNTCDPVKGAEIFQQREAARIERQKRAAEQALFKPSLSPRGSPVLEIRRPVIQPVVTYRKRRSKSAPAWKAAYWALKRRGVDVTEEQVKTDKFFSLPITYREANEIFNSPMPEWLQRVIKAEPEPVKRSQVPQDMRPDPEAARRLSESLKGWQKSKHDRGGSGRAPAVEA